MNIMKKSFDILRKFSLVVTAFVLMQLASPASLVAQCQFDVACPLAPIELEAAAGECDVMVTINVPAASNPFDPSEICTVTASHSSGPFPIGTTVVEFALANGVMCTQDIIISEFGGAISSVACNDLVHLSLDENCQVEVNPDDITEGGPYGCFDLFEVSISGIQGNIITAPGTYTVTVTTPAGNSCWGQVLVEDKIGAILECVDDSTTCSQGTYPGDIIREFYKDTLENITIAAGVSTLLNFTIAGNSSAMVDEVAIKLDIEHVLISDLSATLTSPSGTVVDLFTGPGSLFDATGMCTVPNMSVKIWDEAAYTHTDLQEQCGAGINGALGSFLPEGLFSDFFGEDPNGIWILEIVNGGALAGEAVFASIHLGNSIGVIDFPLDPTFITHNGGNQYTYDDGTACTPVSLVYNDNINNTECSGDFWSQITRTWTAVDPSGNTSGCTQIITVFREDLESVKFPPNYDGFDYPSFDCFDEFDLNSDGNPDISVTGVPHNPSGSFCPNVQFTYEDLRIDICPGAYKVIRKWSLLDWCTGEVIEHDQIIKVEDKNAPIFECPITTDIIYITDAYSCNEDYVVPIPQLTFPDRECNEITWKVQWKAAVPLGNDCVEPADSYYTSNGVEAYGNSYIIYDLPEGCVWIKYTVEDACGNTHEEICQPRVVDGTPPIAVCIEFTVAALGANGCVKIYPSSFDNGSWDNCMIDFMDVRRMDSIYWRPFVEFCCEDLDNNPNMVEFRVTDKQGLSNICMVEVEVQDKLPPILYCPDDVTLDCAEGIPSPDHLGWPTGVDNTEDCIPTEVTWEDVGSANQCGSGVIERVFSVVDTSNPSLTSTCTQYITLVDDDPFYINRNNDFDPNDDVKWPSDVTLEECFSNLHPDNLGVNGYPELYDDACSLVAATYKDQVFTFVPDACEKVIRTWTVIDWCQFEEGFPTEDPNQNGIQDGIWEYVQIIKLTNTNAPEITECEDLLFDGFGECNGTIVMMKNAEDDCTPQEDLLWHYVIDLNNDGTFEPSYAGNDNDASGTYPLGTHKIKWTVEDNCGNKTLCEHTFTIVDAKNPTPYCLSSISTAVMNSNGMVELWASDFDFGSFDNCTDSEDLLFSFSSDVDSTNIVLTCNDIPNGMDATIELQIWVTDEAGNQDYCEVTIELQDNNSDICDDNDSPLVDISGTIRTEDNRMVKNAMISLMSTSMNSPNMHMSSGDGTYSYDNLTSNQTYDLSVEFDENPLNGVSTLDLVFIQKHILGLQILDSPYKIISADVDGNEKVSAIDIVNIRKVILGILDEFPFGTPSWKFVSSDQTFPDATDPFPFTETRTLFNINANKYYEDFIAMKIGDVTYNATTNLTGNGEVENRGNRTIAIETEQAQFSKGDLVRVPVYLADLEEILGFQFNMNIDSKLATFNGLVGESIDIDHEHYSIKDNVLSVSWDKVDGQEVDADEVLFYIELIAQTNSTILETISLQSSTMQSEIYDTDAETYPLGLEIRGADDILETYVLEQNRPNPFSGSTDIAFHLPKSTKVVFNVFDLTGKVIMSKQALYEAGRNVITLTSEELEVTGIMYYSVETEEWSSTKKMIVIK